MFDFQKLNVYIKAKDFHSQILSILALGKLNSTTHDQLRRASLSVVLNIAEGSGRFSKKDRRNFFVISRSSVFECVAIIDVLNDQNIVTSQSYKKLQTKADEISRILYSMIKNLSEWEWCFHSELLHSHNFSFLQSNISILQFYQILPVRLKEKNSTNWIFDFLFMDNAIHSENTFNRTSYIIPVNSKIYL